MIMGAAQQIARAGVQATAAAASGGRDIMKEASKGNSSPTGGGKVQSASSVGSSGSSYGAKASSSQKAPQWAQDLHKKKPSRSGYSRSSSTPGWAQNVLMARGVIPHDTHSGGGVSVQLKEV